MLVRADEADKLIRRFLVAREFPNEFDQGMYKGQQGANGFLSKERWTPGLIDIVQILVKQART